MADQDHDEQNQALRERSGAKRSRDPVVSFLYELMRDHVTPGRVEAIVRESISRVDMDETAYTNGWLADYAEDIAERLREA
jgi:hypothetical protein